MFKKPGNPKIEELTKSHRERRINLSDLKVLKVVTEENGITKVERFCVWCHTVKLHHGNQKYCSNACSSSALAWANPQKEESLNYLLMRQEWKCASCQYDWKPLAVAIFNKMHTYMDGRTIEGFDGSTFGETIDWGLMKRLKSKVPADRLPEVDHIVPISKGGTALGHDNHQAICYTCHKEKTKKDLSGPRKKL